MPHASGVMLWRTLWGAEGRMCPLKLGTRAKRLGTKSTAAKVARTSSSWMSDQYLLSPEGVLACTRRGEILNTRTAPISRKPSISQAALKLQQSCARSESIGSAAGSCVTKDPHVACR